MKVRSAKSLLEQGLQARLEHRLKYAQNLFGKALDESRSMDDGQLRARLFAELAYVERTLGQLEHAREHYFKAAQLYRELSQPLKWAHAARHAADILREQGNPDESGRLYAEVLEIYRAYTDADPLDRANALRGYALLKTEARAMEDATALWKEARDVYLQEDVPAGVEECSGQIEALKAS